MAIVILTKSQFMAYTRCPLELWLHKYRPDLLPVTDESTQLIFDMGNQIDALAKNLFPNGVEIAGYNHAGWENTQKAMEQGATVLFQPTAVTTELSAKADIVTRAQTPGKWEIREVKMGTKVDAEYITDVAFQKICFEEAGVPIDRTYLVHVNNQYVKQGEIDVQSLLMTEDITEEVEGEIPAVRKQIAEALKLLDDHSDFSHLLLQRCSNPHKCEILEHFSVGYKESHELAHELPHEYLHAMLKRGLLRHELLKSELLEQIGYTPPEEFHEVDLESLKQELSQLVYPLYFIDYETSGPAIPVYDGLRPYQQVPFQYALYIKDSPDAEPRLLEFLATESKNPIPDFASSLKSHIGPVGSVIVWNKTFEKMINRQVGELLPEYQDFMQDLNDRVFDLKDVFIFKRQIYTHSEFNGRTTLKIVLPVICPELSYKSLGIKNGGEATSAWPKLVDSATPAEEKAKIEKDLRAYCSLDSYAMVRIFDHLQDRLKQGK